MRKRNQRGGVDLEKRASGIHVWRWRFREKDASGKYVRVALRIGTIKEFPTRSAAQAEADRIRSGEKREVASASSSVTLAFVVIRYRREEKLDDEGDAELAFSTRKGYRSVLANHILPRWGEMPIDRIKPFAVKEWIKDLNLAPKTKGNIKGLMQALWRCAMLWEYLDTAVNPMQLITIRGCTKRQDKPRALTFEEAWLILNQLKDPWFTMAFGQLCFGLGLSELLALKWNDFNWLEGLVHIRRRNVDNRIEETTKTEARNDVVPLHPGAAHVFLRWRGKTDFKDEDDFVFASPFSAGKSPYFPNGFQQRHISPVAKKVGLKGIGSHTFRRSYRVWLDGTGAPIGVQQKLMRHADVRTTMSYGEAPISERRDANYSVVEKLIPS